MAINIGNSSINSIYIGDTAVKSVYLGDNLVYSKQSEPSTEIDDTYNYYVFDTSLASGTTIFLQDYRGGDTTEWSGITNWGDGTVDTKLSHKYAKNGTYTVKTKYMMIDGSKFAYEVNTINMLIECININKNVTNYNLLFYNCINLSNVHTSNFYTSNVTSMYRTFYGCSSLESLNLSGWDTSNVTDMHSIFYSCSSLTELDLSSWNTVNVTDMCSAFAYCSRLSLLNISNWNMDNMGIGSYENLFLKCTNLTIDNIIMTNCSEDTINYINYSIQFSK